MKKTLILVIIATFFLGCNCTKNSSKNNDKPIAVGNDSDQHGCKASAGYTWSVLKKDCIKTWETGTQLTPVDNTGSSTSNAAVIFSDDYQKAELFIVLEKSSVILKNTGSKTTTFKGSGYELMEIGNKWTLKKDDKTIYEK